MCCSVWVWVCVLLVLLAVNCSFLFLEGECSERGDFEGMMERERARESEWCHRVWVICALSLTLSVLSLCFLCLRFWMTWMMPIWFPLFPLFMYPIFTERWFHDFVSNLDSAILWPVRDCCCILFCSDSKPNVSLIFTVYFMICCCIQSRSYWVDLLLFLIILLICSFHCV